MILWWTSWHQKSSLSRGGISVRPEVLTSRKRVGKLRTDQARHPCTKKKTRQNTEKSPRHHHQDTHPEQLQLPHRPLNTMSNAPEVEMQDAAPATSPATPEVAEALRVRVVSAPPSRSQQIFANHSIAPRRGTWFRFLPD